MGGKVSRITFSENTTQLTKGSLGRGVVTKPEMEEMRSLRDGILTENDFRKRHEAGEKIKEKLRETIGSRTSDGVDNYTYLLAAQRVDNVVAMRDAVSMNYAGKENLDIEVGKLHDSFAEIQTKYGQQPQPAEQSKFSSILKAKRN